jgi:hypothetical protein
MPRSAGSRVQACEGRQIDARFGPKQTVADCCGNRSVRSRRRPLPTKRDFKILTGSIGETTVEANHSVEAMAQLEQFFAATTGPTAKGGRDIEPYVVSGVAVWNIYQALSSRHRCAEPFATLARFAARRPVLRPLTAVPTAHRAVQRRRITGASFLAPDVGAAASRERRGPTSRPQLPASHRSLGRAVRSPR